MMVARDDEVDPYRFTVGKFMAYLKSSESVEDVADRQWESIISFVRRGMSKQLQLVGVTDLAVRAVGGLNAIGMTEEDNLRFLRKQFIDAFKSRASIADIKLGLQEYGTRVEAGGPQQPDNLPRSTTRALELMAGVFPDGLVEEDES